MADYENLGFQVNVDSDSAVSRLDDIIDRLEKIQKLGGLGGSKPNTTTPLSEEEKYAKRVAKQTELLNSAKYQELRRTELLNEQRKKEIDQRLKQELGIKQNTKSLTSYIAKLTSVVVLAKKLAHFMSGAIKESAEYVENLNLFAVAYGKTYQEQIDWALGIVEAYGLANNEVLKFAGTFRELSTSLGLVGDTADLVSKVVTNLGYDLSALFNTTVEQAMEKLQSGVFSGNVRPLRAYGIDISQQQINALFETSEALRQLGVNAQNLNQSDKVLARLIITLQSGKDSFGTMAREINNLQSEFRIFEGSLSNLKLAIGDALNKPLSEAMVYINGFIIGITNVIRAFVPLTTEDATPKAIINTATSAEEASEELDKLQGKLAGFDKFNVLQQGGGETSSIAVTEALNQLLLEQAAIYESQLGNLDEINNRAVEIGENIKNWFVVEVGKDEKGNPIYKLTTQAETLLETLKYVGLYLGVSLVGKIGGAIKAILSLTKGFGALNTALMSGAILAFVKMVQAIEEGDTGMAILAGTIGVALVGALIAYKIHQYSAAKATKLATLAQEKQCVTLTKQSYAMQQTAYYAKVATISMAAFAGSYMLAEGIINSFDGEARKTASGIMILVGAIMAVTAAIVAMKGVLSWGTALPILLAGVGAAIAGVKGMMTDVNSIAGFADGGYTNANLIMTHENGKREWVGKAAGSSAIVNDTQMSDIMELAVAKGVYQAMTARSQMSGPMQDNRPIVVQVDGKTIFEATRGFARKQGLDYSKV